MFMNCQKCNADVEPGIDRNTLDKKQATPSTKALCPFCDTQLPVSSFMMKTLISLGQFHSKTATRAAFSFKCTPCDKIQPATLSRDKKAALCSSCNADLNLTAVMIKAMAIAKAGGIDSNV